MRENKRLRVRVVRDMFRGGQYVCIRKLILFAKAVEHNFITEIFRVAKLTDWRPRALYVLEDLNGTPIDGQFTISNRTLYALPLAPLTTGQMYQTGHSRITRSLARLQSGL